MKTPLPEMDFSHIIELPDGRTAYDLGILKSKGPEHVGGFMIQHLLDDAEPILLAWEGEVIATLLPGDRLAA